MIAIFDREVNNTVLKIENAARSFPKPDKTLKSGLSHLLSVRLADLYGQLVDVVGQDQAENLLAQIKQQELHSDANDQGSRRKSVR